MPIKLSFILIYVMTWAKETNKPSDVIDTFFLNFNFNLRRRSCFLLWDSIIKIYVTHIRPAAYGFSIYCSFVKRTTTIFLLHFGRTINEWMCCRCVKVDLVLVGILNFFFFLFFFFIWINRHRCDVVKLLKWKNITKTTTAGKKKH